MRRLAMRHKIYPAARRRIIVLWQYTDKTWGEKQANKYVRGRYNAVEKDAINKYLWRKVEHEDVKGSFFGCYKHHDIFFRKLSKDLLGIVNVLQVNMDIPGRLKEDMDE